MKLHELFGKVYPPEKHIEYDVVAIDESANTYEIDRIAISEGEERVYIKIREQ